MKGSFDRIIVKCADSAFFILKDALSVTGLPVEKYITMWGLNIPLPDPSSLYVFAFEEFHHELADFFIEVARESNVVVVLPRPGECFLSTGDPLPEIIFVSPERVCDTAVQKCLQKLEGNLPANT